MCARTCDISNHHTPVFDSTAHSIHVSVRPDSMVELLVENVRDAYIAHATYTFGPALRTPGVKNLGTSLAPEKLRTCPWVAHG